MLAKLKKDYRTKNVSYSIGGTTISRRLSLESSKHGLMSPQRSKRNLLELFKPGLL
jgi:hypothetical protein